VIMQNRSGNNMGPSMSHLLDNSKTNIG
jgi:hypothetical protein